MGVTGVRMYTSIICDRGGAVDQCEGPGWGPYTVTRHTVSTSYIIIVQEYNATNKGALMSCRRRVTRDTVRLGRVRRGCVLRFRVLCVIL